MFFDDRRRAVAEMARVLRDHGTVAVATWTSITTSPGYAAMVALLRDVAGDDAADALFAPFSIGTAELLADHMKVAFPDVRVTEHPGTARFASIEAWLHTDIRGWTLAGMIDDATSTAAPRRGATRATGVHRRRRRSGL